VPAAAAADAVSATKARRETTDSGACRDIEITKVEGGRYWSAPALRAIRLGSVWRRPATGFRAIFPPICADYIVMQATVGTLLAFSTRDRAAIRAVIIDGGMPGWD
jgi:hypothetical protein